MKKYFGIALFVLAAALFPELTRAASPAEAGASSAEAAASSDPYRGRILIDVSNRGEAWYVNPQTLSRVYLGRPDEALERLKDRTILVNYAHIARLAETADAPCDEEYAKQVAGYVLSPNDLVGASWYVDPSTGLRRRLATAFDAWEVLRAGLPVGREVLHDIPVEGPDPAGAARTVVARIKEVRTATLLELEDGSTVRLLNVEVPSNSELQDAAIAKIREVARDRTVLLERDVVGKDHDGVLARHVHVGTTNVNYELVRSGLAFHSIEEPNFKYAELLIVGGLDAARLKRGFWHKD